MIIKLIRLTPLGEFFFGGEETFGNDNRNYYVRSRLMPQQTSLLGLVRHELLKKADPSVFDGQKVLKAEDASKIIGNQSFDGSNDSAFGIIEGLSPVFFQKDKKGAYFFRANGFFEGNIGSRLKSKALIFQNLLKGEAKKQVEILEMKEENKWKTYNGKTDFESKIIGLDHSFPVYFNEKEDKGGIFIKVAKTGNQKNYKGESDDKAFFKQDFYKLNGGWSFVFLVAFNSENDLPEKNLVTLGTEQRPFQWEMSDLPEGFNDIKFENSIFQNFENLYPQDTTPQYPPSNSLILLSDTATDSGIYAHTTFSAVQTIGFRNLKTALRDPNEAFKAGEKPKTDYRTLIQRGSLLKAADTVGGDKISENLVKNKAFRRIGYNYFKIIK